MAARVFISCGQATQCERRVAEQLRTWFEGQGFEPYLAVYVQTIADLNAGIVAALKSCDYYLFVNFKREKVLRDCESIYRGSLYSHQELAIAYSLGYDHMLVLNQQGVHDEGVQKFIVSNTPRFTAGDEVLHRVQEAAARWSPQYSRQLALGTLRWADPVLFGDHSGSRLVRVLHGDIHNNRDDRAAYGLIARLAAIRDAETDAPVEHSDRTVLKATGFQGFQHTTWPNTHCAFDLLAQSVENPNELYLNSSLDVPREPVIFNPGTYLLDYEFVAQDFPVLRCTLRLQHTGAPELDAPSVVERSPENESSPE